MNMIPNNINTRINGRVNNKLFGRNICPTIIFRLSVKSNWLLESPYDLDMEKLKKRNEARNHWKGERARSIVFGSKLTEEEKRLELAKLFPRR